MNKWMTKYRAVVLKMWAKILRVLALNNNVYRWSRALLWSYLMVRNEERKRERETDYCYFIFPPFIFFSSRHRGRRIHNVLNVVFLFVLNSIRVILLSFSQSNAHKCMSMSTYQRIFLYAQKMSIKYSLHKTYIRIRSLANSEKWERASERPREKEQSEKLSSSCECWNDQLVRKL